MALVESAYRGEGSRAGWTTEADLLDGQRTDAAMIRETLDRPEGIVLLARRASRLLACCELRRPRVTAPSSTEPGASEGAAYLGMFSVDPDLQGGGIGRAMLGEAEHRP